MVLRKTCVSENVWSDLEISEAVLMGPPGYRSLVFRQFLRPAVTNFFADGSGVTDLSFYLLFGLQESNFSELMSTAYNSN